MTDKPNRPGRTRSKWATITLRVLRYVWLPLLCLVALYAGMVIGYVYLGGQPMSEVMKTEAWVHVFKLVFGQ